MKINIVNTNIIDNTYNTKPAKQYIAFKSQTKNEDIFENSNQDKKAKNIIKNVLNYFEKKIETQKIKNTTRIQKDEIPTFIEEENKKFYSSYHDLDEIEDFEYGKKIISSLINIKPSYLSYEEQSEILTKTLENGISRNLINEILYKNTVAYHNLTRQASYCFENSTLYQNNWTDLNEVYYSQIRDFDGFINNIKKLIKEEKLNLDSTPEDKGNTPHFSKEEILSIINRYKDVTLGEQSLLEDKYEEDDFYDFPLKFATASYNSYHLGHKYIKNNIPDIFKDINEKELFEMLDLLSYHIRLSSYMDYERLPIQKIKIKGIDFNVVALKRGYECFPMKFFRKGYNPVVMKTYYEKSFNFPHNIIFGPTSFYGNIGMLYEANKAGVTDVSELYMAAPIFKPVSVKDKKSFTGGWAIVEDAFTKKKSSGLKMDDWLSEKGLTDFDLNKGTYINDIFVDTGFIQNKKSSEIYLFEGNEDINNVYTRYLGGETTEEIIEYLKN